MANLFFSFEKWLAQHTDWATRNGWLQVAATDNGRVAMWDGRSILQTGRNLREACRYFEECLPGGRYYSPQAESEEKEEPAAAETPAAPPPMALTVGAKQEVVERRDTRTITFEIDRGMYDRAQALLAPLGMEIEDLLPAVLESSVLGQAAGTMPDLTDAASPFFDQIANRAARRRMQRGRW